MKDYLKKVIAQRQKKIADIREAIKKSESVEEVRSLTVELENYTTELREAEDTLKDLESREADKKDDFNAMGTYGVQNENRSNEDIYDSLEYRKAFQEFVSRGTPIPAEFREDQTTYTTDVETTIPTTLLNRIVERIEESGMILPLVTKTAFPTGIAIPTSSVKPVATWVAEGAGSDKQKKTTGKIIFSYYKLRCEIAVSQEVHTMALPAFEALFERQVAEAMVVAQEKAILAGDADGKPTGILTGTIADDKIVKFAATGVTYEDLCDAEALVPAAYEDRAVWFMTKKAFMDIYKMTDEAGQPVGRINFGINGKPQRILLGREVVCHPYAEEMGDYFAGIFDFSDYALNTIYNLGITRRQDWDTEDWQTKAVMSVDGKPVSLDSLVLLKQNA